RGLGRDEFGFMRFGFMGEELVIPLGHSLVLSDMLGALGASGALRLIRRVVLVFHHCRFLACASYRRARAPAKQAVVVQKAISRLWSPMLRLESFRLR